MDFIAKNLQDFIFAKLLSEMALLNTYRFEIVEECRNKLKNVFKTHQKYLTDEQNAILNQYAKADVVEYCFCNSIEKGFLTYDQCQQLLQQTINFDKFNQSICYKNS